MTYMLPHFSGKTKDILHSGFHIFAEVSYLDAQIGKVLAELKRLQLDKNTIVILWGDHGWHLGDDRVWGKHTLTEWSTRSPLIIKLSGQEQAIQCDRIVSAIDIYPTLMELCNLSMPYVADGRSLVPFLQGLPDDREEAAFSYFKKGYHLTHGTLPAYLLFAR